MNVRRFHLWLWISLVLASVGFFTVRTVYTAPQGDQRLYIPQVGRAQPDLSEYIGVADSPPVAGPTSTPDGEIYTFRGDDSVPTRLTDNEWFDQSPLWSPDGSMILWRQSEEPFDTSGDTYSDVWLMNRDGTNARNISNLPGLEYGRWAPDGHYILIHKLGGDDMDSFYVTTPTAITPTLLLNVDSDSTISWEWSPTENRFFYITSRQESDGFVYTLHSMNLDGSAPTLLADGISQNGSAWSPDGAWIAYNQKTNDQWDVYVVRPDGSERRQLTSELTNEGFQGWVEGGTRIIVGRPVIPDLPTYSLDLVSVETGVSTPFVVGDETDSAYIVGISPDGTQVVYNFGTQDRSRLYVQNTNSLISTPISPDIDYGYQIRFAGWSSDEQEVAYSSVYLYPGNSSSVLYVACVNATEPAYRELDPTAVIVQWLPYSHRLIAYLDPDGFFNRTLHFIDTRTNEKRALPFSPEGQLRYVNWWYEGSGQ